MSLRMLTVLLFVAAISFAPLCAAGWYTAKIVVAVFSAAGSLYCGARDRCDCVREEIAVLRNASLAQCAWVQATVLREKAAEALVASGLWQWLKRCEWFPDIWTLLALALSLFIARRRCSGRKRKDDAKVARPLSRRCVTTSCKHPGADGDRVCHGSSQGTERKQHTFAPASSMSDAVTAVGNLAPRCVPFGYLPAAPSSAASRQPPHATAPPRRTAGARRLSGSSSHSWPPPSRRRSGPEPRAAPWGQPHLAPASKWVFGELLQECRHGASVTFDVVLKEIGARGCIKLNESPDSELFCIVGRWRRSVIKVLRFEYVVRHRDLVLAEVRVGRAVQGIVANLHNTTAGLSRLRTAYCVWGKYPELLTSACRSYRERKGSGFVTDDEHDLCLPYVVLHMSFAGWPLSNTTLESPLQLWSVVQQVALTLAVAEEALEFEHRAPSEDHVLVKKAHHDVLSFRLNGRVLHVNTFGVHAFLVDFCASRLRPLGDVEPLFTDLKKMPRRKRDAMGETFAKICSLVGEEPWQYCPKTNVACLEGLTRSLVRRFESRFAAAVDEAEQEAWCDMCFWLDEMPYCASATELALQMVM
ncbi:uncharacterized protein LOC142578441 [Dermacentor variabilis]|uniref:uncharacterized protein LOC142578441 n=1 Tax=Dermacentor variabilis TaxID=34621 RepID=UPI003F5CB627